MADRIDTLEGFNHGPNSSNKTRDESISDLKQAELLVYKTVYCV